MFGRRRTHKTAKVIGELPRSYDPIVSEWGNPSRLIAGYFDIYVREKTRRTEISKYPEEKKSHEIPLVSDERTGNSPNRNLFRGCRTSILDI